MGKNYQNFRSSFFFFDHNNFFKETIFSSIFQIIIFEISWLSTSLSKIIFKLEIEYKEK